jgi:hypothetical protein
MILNIQNICMVFHLCALDNESLGRQGGQKFDYTMNTC